MQFFPNTNNSQELWIIILNYFVEKRSMIRHILCSSLILVKLEGDVVKKGSFFDVNVRKK